MFIVKTLLIDITSLFFYSSHCNDNMKMFGEITGLLVLRPPIIDEDISQIPL